MLGDGAPGRSAKPNPNAEQGQQQRSASGFPRTRLVHLLFNHRNELQRLLRGQLDEESGGWEQKKEPRKTAERNKAAPPSSSLHCSLMRKEASWPEPEPRVLRTRLCLLHPVSGTRWVRNKC